MNKFVEKRDKLTDPYVTAGNRVYIIGTQDGGFPDSGGHIPGEMGGVWNHPIKLIDAFYVGLSTEKGLVWPQATQFRAYPFYTEHVVEDSEFQLIRRQFVPDDEEAAVITLTYTQLSGKAEHRNLLFAVKSDLRPGWLSTEEDGIDIAAERDGHVLFTDALHPWTAMVGTSYAAYSIDFRIDAPHDTQGQGTASCISIPLSAELGKPVTIHFVIAGSNNGVDACQRTLERVLGQVDSLFHAKATRYERMDRGTSLVVPDEVIQRAIPWVKYNTDWLVRKTEMGNGLGAGLPEYPWWFGCDNGYALKGVLALGWFDLAKDTLRLLARVSEAHNGDGRIIHEVSTTGVVFNPGNVQETPQFCSLVWDVYLWTGDKEFAAEMYPVVKKGIEWTLSQAEGEEDFPRGYGIIEVEHLNDRLIDAAVFTYCALDAAANIADLLDDSFVASILRPRAEKLRQDILRRYWSVSEGLFADMISNPRAMNPRLKEWSKRAEQRGLREAAQFYLSLVDESDDSSDLDKPYLLRHWVINTPLEQRMVSSDVASRVLARMRTSEFTGPYGLYLSGTERQAMMTISTAVQAMAEGAYGNADEAVNYVRQIASTLSLRTPGSISEMSPDYGCFVQAWTVYGVFNPIIHHLFGVSPVAHERACILKPTMPSTWNDASLSQLHIGDNVLDFSYHRAAGKEYLTVQTEQEWIVHFLTPVVVHSGEEAIVENVAEQFVLAGGSKVTFRLINKDTGGI